MPDWNGLLYRVAEAIALPVAAVIAGYVALVLHRYAKKLGLEVSAEQDQQIRTTVQNSIMQVEELARARWKAGAIATLPEEKRVDAVTVASQQLPDKNTQQIAALVNEELPKVRAALQPSSMSGTPPTGSNG